METKFNFKSQIATDRNQSKRLLALGLNKETADMIYERNVQYPYDYDLPRSIYEDEEFITGVECDDIPAWSLGRLIEMMPYYIEMYKKDWCLQVSKGYVRYASNGKEKSYIGFIQRPNTFDAICECIEWLIKEGHFNKEYLEE